ncbi:MAG: HpsJ family protein [Prochlorothrix sp.]
MTQSEGGQITQAINQLWKSRTGLLTSFDVAHMVGYALLLLALFDVIALLIPPEFGNPTWQFGVFGQLIERMPVPIIGLALVFAGGLDKRQPWELPVLSVTSWLTAVIGVIYLLMIPWSGFTTLRLYRGTNAQVEATIQQQRTQLEQVRTNLDSVQSEEDLARLVSQITNRTIFPEDLTEPADTIKTELQTALAEGESNIEAQAQTALSQSRLQLFKNSIKWNLGALVSAAILLLMWRSTVWARTPE